jgi:tetratricopeptide (TPR) repeat protein
MASDVTQAAAVFDLWAWFESHKKQVAWGGLGLAAAGLVAGFLYWQQGARQVAASESFSKVFVRQTLGGAARTESPGPYLEVVAHYPNSQAGARALLVAAGGLFVEGKYSEAQAQFGRFTREYRDSPLLGEALLGVAASLDALGKTNEAINAYRDLTEHHPNDVVGPQAKYALASLYEGQGKPEEARRIFEDLAIKESNGSIGAEASLRLQEINLKHPELVRPPAQPPMLPSAGLAPAPAPARPGTAAPSNAAPPKAENP